jgi:ferredoxin
MSSPYWIRTLINRIYGARFFLSRLTHCRFFGRLADWMLFRNDNVIFLPKDEVLPVHETVEAPEGMVLPSEVVAYFIQNASFIWIMDFCICRDSAKCGSYPVESGCIFLGAAAKGINPRFGRPATAEQALAHARQCREAGLVHMIGRNHIDTVWLNVGPPEKLMTICNCCPCCCLWQTLAFLSPGISRKIRRMPGIHMEVGETCTGCGICTSGLCFVDAIHIEKGRAVIDQNRCRGCGRCAEACPQGAVSLVAEERGCIEAAIRQISQSVDLSD